MAQNDRTAELGDIEIPALIIHGDADPLVPIAGGQATAEAIPGAAFMIVSGMGHVMPNLNAYWDKIKEAMITHMGDVA
jgi:pimeloyl-ACP methyl ester carboxylesterase